jgi:peptide/nickel transport system substrate-binding protein
VLAVALSALATVASLLPAVGPVLGQQPAATPAGPANLLSSPPFDQITLTDGTVLVVDPISPRPLPPIDPKKKKKGDTFRYKGSKTDIPIGGNIGMPGEPSKLPTSGDDKERAEEPEDESERSVKIHLLQETEVRDYSVKRSNIKSVEYFEDLLLAEAHRLVLARDFGRGFECLLRVKSRNPEWAGLNDRVNELLFAEGSAALLGGDHERGLRLLRELLGRKRDYPGLLDQLASAYGKWIARALELNQFAKGRRFLHELEKMAPEHVVCRQMRDRFVERASKRVKDAQALEGPARLDALLDALRIWPTLDGAAELYTRAFEKVPTLDVAVCDVPAPLGPWVRSPADARVTRLLYRPILASDSEDARQGKAPGQLAAALEASDLGRRLVIRLLPAITWSDGSRPVSAVDLARAIIDRSDPNSPKFQARWAEILDRVASPDDMRVELRLTRPLIKLGSWFDWPVGPAHAGLDGRVATVDQRRLLVSNGPFRCAAASDHEIDLSLASDSAASPASSPSSPRVARLREIRYLNPRSLTGALVQGEVSLAARVPADQLATLSTHPEIKIGRYTQPLMHFIAMDARNPVLRNRSLRRALSYGIDRKTLLEETVVKGPLEDGTSVADGPFPKGSFADAPCVQPLEYNPTLCAMLVAGARRELGNDPIQLKFEYPAVPEAQAAVPVIAEAWRAAGLRIETIERPESQLETELRSGRRFDLAYRALRCEDPILDAGVMLCPGYDAPEEADALASGTSTEIMQLLLQLERAAEVPTARGLAIRIDRESRTELPIVPLWQLVDHYAWRTRLTGPAETSDRLYDGIETWEVKPWFARDPWTKP